MDPIRTLLEEHQLIQKAFENLTLAIEMMENNEKVSMSFFKKWREFYSSFILDYHHFKEEYVLFRELAQKQNGAIDAQLDALRYQHERGRDIMNQVNGSLLGYEKDNPHDTSTLLENLAAYVSLIRHHIHREEHIYYPMVMTLFSETEKKSLTEALRAEDEKTPPHIRQRHIDVVNEMAQQLKK